MPMSDKILHSYLGRTKKTYTQLDLKLRVPPNEVILYAMLRLCIHQRIPDEVLLLKVTDMKTERMVTKAFPQMMHGRCLEIQVTKIIKSRRKPNVAEISVSLKLNVKVYNGLQSDRYWLYRNTKSDLMNEAIVFSKRSEKLRFSHALHEEEFHEKELHEEDQSRSMKKEINGCYRKKMIVNFATLGYSDIIAPTIFDAGQCVGRCKYPLGRLSYPTQHSIIQQLLHSLYGDRIAKSTCCSPRKFLPLTTLINDKYSGRVAIRSLEDMIVSGCRCV